MSRLLVLMPKDNYDAEQLDHLAGAINLNGLLITKSSENTDSFFAVATSKQALFKDGGLFENNRWLVLIAGDIIEHDILPYTEIIKNLDNDNANYFAGLNGIFTIAAFDKHQESLFIISDRRAQQPIYYHLNDDRLFLSTELAAFCRLKEEFLFNEKWLWEYLFFNYPVSSTTFLKGVKRIPPSSIIKYDKISQDFSMRKYAGNFKKQDVLLDGIEALEFASEVLSDRIPQYFNDSDDIACALTAGWDGRTMLALSQKHNISAYTYGVPGCQDLKGGSETAKLANVSHIGIHFDDKFTNDLPYYMKETVYLSSGLQNILRATLLYAYSKLSDDGNRYPLTISGISMDMQFRGHACSPPLISHDVGKIFESGNIDIRKDFWSSFVKANYASFKEHIVKMLKSLENDYGKFDSTEHHLSYIVYVLSTQYFCGELSLADYFTTVRVPCWDSKIINLSYMIKYSTLSFSQYSSHTRGDREELILQSYLLNNYAPIFANIPIGNTRPDIVLKGKTIYQLYRIYRGVLKRTAGLVSAYTKPVPLEDWEQWLNVLYRDFIDDLIFSKDSRIRNYISDEFLLKLSKDRELHLIGKLATVEIIIRLMESNWQRV